jgi:hypothetical protein
MITNSHDILIKHTVLVHVSGLIVPSSGSYQSFSNISLWICDNLSVFFVYIKNTEIRFLIEFAMPIEPVKNTFYAVLVVLYKEDFKGIN